MVLFRVFVQNGLAFYLTWVSFLTIFNFATYITYNLLANQVDSGTVALSFILVLILIYFILDNFVWQRFLLNVLAPYIVIIIVLIGSLAKNFNSTNISRNNAFLLSIMLIASFLTILKCGMYYLYKTVCMHRYDINKERDLNYSSGFRNLLSNFNLNIFNFNFDKIDR